MPPTSTARRDPRGLTRGQVAFLLERSKHPTDGTAARAAGISPTTVSSWKAATSNSFSPQFVAEYNRIFETRALALAEFNAERLKAELVPPAWDRMKEILTSPITKDMEINKVNQIRQAATTVLTGAGILQASTDNEFTRALGKVISEGKAYKPRWAVLVASDSPSPALTSADAKA